MNNRREEGIFLKMTDVSDDHIVYSHYENSKLSIVMKNSSTK
jgi:hypothetical protein